MGAELTLEESSSIARREEVLVGPQVKMGAWPISLMAVEWIFVGTGRDPGPLMVEGQWAAGKTGIRPEKQREPSLVLLSKCYQRKGHWDHVSDWRMPAAQSSSLPLPLQ